MTSQKEIKFTSGKTVEKILEEAGHRGFNSRHPKWEERMKLTESNSY